MRQKLPNGHFLESHGFYVRCDGRYALYIYIQSSSWPATGYDVSLIGNFFAYPTFAKKYGNYYPDIDGGTYTLTAPWQSGIGNASGVGAFFGVMLNGWLVDLYGQKRTLLGSLVALAGFVFITFFAPNIGTLTAGEVLCGLPWYVFCISCC
jgi:MFS transporter, SP family, general alpha glucoside:H+ symporter